MGWGEWRGPNLSDIAAAEPVVHKQLRALQPCLSPTAVCGTRLDMVKRRRSGEGELACFAASAYGRQYTAWMAVMALDQVSVLRTLP